MAATITAMNEIDCIIISHTCGHQIPAPAAYMPPHRVRKEESRDCAECRDRERAGAAMRNWKRGLPQLDGSRCSPRQMLLAEELRERYGWALENAGDRQRTDPIWWIAEYAAQKREDDAAEAASDRPAEVVAAPAANLTAAETARQDQEFERIFGDGPCDPEPPSGGGGGRPRACETCGQVESAEVELVEREGWVLCVACAEEGPEPAPEPVEEETMAEAKREAPLSCTLGVDIIAPSPLNPRKTFDPAGLEELAASIREHGLVEPIVVASCIGHGKYPIIAGERRWRAAKLAGLKTVPVVLRTDVKTEQETLELMLVENLQRQDLNPIEEAQAYARLAEMGLTQEQIAAKVGRSRPAVANAMRLLGLPEAVRAMVSDGRLTAAHGVALLAWAGDPSRQVGLAQACAQGRTTSKDLVKLAAEEKRAEERHARIVAEAAAIAEEDAEERAEAGAKGGQVAATSRLPYDAAAIDRSSQEARQREEERLAARALRAEVLACGVEHTRLKAGSILEDSRVIALLTWESLRSLSLNNLERVLLITGCEALLELFDWEKRHTCEEQWEALAALPPEILVTLAFQARCQPELEAFKRFGNEPRWVAWYVGAAAEVEP